jgi:hypothetical protein
MQFEAAAGEGSFIFPLGVLVVRIFVVVFVGAAIFVRGVIVFPITNVFRGDCRFGV